MLDSAIEEPFRAGQKQPQACICAGCPRKLWDAMRPPLGPSVDLHSHPAAVCAYASCTRFRLSPS